MLLEGRPAESPPLGLDLVVYGSNVQGNRYTVGTRLARWGTR